VESLVSRIHNVLAEQGDFEASLIYPLRNVQRCGCMSLYDNSYQAKRCPVAFKYLLVVSTFPNPYQLSSVILISDLQATGLVV